MLLLVSANRMSLCVVCFGDVFLLILYTYDYMDIYVYHFFFGRCVFFKWFCKGEIGAFFLPRGNSQKRQWKMEKSEPFEFFVFPDSPARDVPFASPSSLEDG